MPVIENPRVRIREDQSHKIVSPKIVSMAKAAVQHVRF